MSQERVKALMATDRKRLKRVAAEIRPQLKTQLPAATRRDIRRMALEMAADAIYHHDREKELGL